MSNMAINTNVLALNSHRSLKAVGSKQEKASTRLSSGYRINSAADDAAGLAISEKMRAQIRGLDMASKNSQDAVSLIQTAEGGMQEIDNMLQRTRELLVQVSNDTNDQSTDESESVQGDRQKIQDEINQLMQEIDSMADRVEFNKKKVINGSFADATKALEDAQAKLESATDAKTNATTGTAAKLVTAQDNVKAAADYSTLKKIDDRYKAEKAAFEAANSVDALKKAFEDALSAFAPTINESNVDSGDKGTAFTTGISDAITAIRSAFESASASDLADAAMFRGTIATAIQTALGGTDVLAAGQNIGTLSMAADGTITTTSATLTGEAALMGELSKIGEAAVAVLEKATVYGAAEGGTAPTFDEAAFFAKAENTYTPTHSDNVGTPVGTHGGATGAATYVDFGNILSDAKTTATPSGATEPLSVAAANKAVTEAKLADDVAGFNISRYDAQVKAAESLSDSKSLYFQVGANADQKLELNISSVKTDTLGLGNGKGETLINVVKASGSEINHYMNALDEALTLVTTERSKLGAAQNRLEYTQKSLDISSENLTSAESRIRDTDMAKEMMNLTQSNVLQSAATSMLAQANQSKQSILQLLQ